MIGVESLQRGRDHVIEVQAALMGSAHDAGERLLRVGSARGAMAAADFPLDDSGLKRVFGSPIRGVYVKVP